MKNNDYVLKHNFGYGKIGKRIKIKKLKLRNVEDLQIYLFDILPKLFNAKFENQILIFDDNTKIRIDLITE